MRPPTSFHETLHRTATRPGPTNRAFGLTVGPILLLLACRPLLKQHPLHWPLAAVGLALTLAALAAPQCLTPLNRAWMRLGDLLGAIMGPVMLGLIFFLVVTPMRVWLYLSRHDPMRRRPDPSATSYWLPRQPPGPAPETMVNQF